MPFYLRDAVDNLNPKISAELPYFSDHFSSLTKANVSTTDQPITANNPNIKPLIEPSNISRLTGIDEAYSSRENIPKYPSSSTKAVPINDGWITDLDDNTSYHYQAGKLVERKILPFFEADTGSDAISAIPRKDIWEINLDTDLDPASNSKHVSFVLGDNASIDEETRSLDNTLIADEEIPVASSSAMTKTNHIKHSLEQMSLDKKPTATKQQIKTLPEKPVLKDTTKAAGNLASASAGGVLYNGHGNTPLSASAAGTQGAQIQSGTNGAAVVEHLFGFIANWFRRKAGIQDKAAAKEVLAENTQLITRFDNQNKKLELRKKLLLDMKNKSLKSNFSLLTKEIKLLESEIKELIAEMHALEETIKGKKLEIVNALAKLKKAEQDKFIGTLASSRYAAQLLLVSGFSVPKLALDATNTAATAAKGMGATSGLAMACIAPVATGLALYGANEDRKDASNATKAKNKAREAQHEFETIESALKTRADCKDQDIQQIDKQINEISDPLISKQLQASKHKKEEEKEIIQSQLNSESAMTPQELAIIARMAKCKQTVWKKWTSFIGNILSAGGYATMGTVGALSFAAAVSSFSGIAAIPIVGWALAGTGAAIALGLIIHTYVKYRKHKTEKIAITQQINSNDQAMQKSGHLKMLATSGKYAVHYLVSQFQLECKNMKDIQTSQIYAFLKHFMNEEELHMVIDNIKSENSTTAAKFIARKLNLPVQIRQREDNIDHQSLVSTDDLAPRHRRPTAENFGNAGYI